MAAADATETSELCTILQDTLDGTLQSSVPDKHEALGTTLHGICVDTARENVRQAVKRHMPALARQIMTSKLQNTREQDTGAWSALTAKVHLVYIDASGAYVSTCGTTYKDGVLFVKQALGTFVLVVHRGTAALQCVPVKSMQTYTIGVSTLVIDSVSSVHGEIHCPGPLSIVSLHAAGVGLHHTLHVHAAHDVCVAVPGDTFKHGAIHIDADGSASFESRALQDVEIVVKADVAVHTCNIFARGKSSLFLCAFAGVHSCGVSVDGDESSVHLAALEHGANVSKNVVCVKGASSSVRAWTSGSIGQVAHNTLKCQGRGAGIHASCAPGGIVHANKCASSGEMSSVSLYAEGDTTHWSGQDTGIQHNEILTDGFMSRTSLTTTGIPCPIAFNSLEAFGSRANVHLKQHHSAPSVPATQLSKRRVSIRNNAVRALDTCTEVYMLQTADIGCIYNNTIVAPHATRVALLNNVGAVLANFDGASENQTLDAALSNKDKIRNNYVVSSVQPAFDTQYNLHATREDDK